MNSTAWVNSPVTEASAAVLEAMLPGRVAKRLPREDREYAVFSYQEDFVYLWQVDNSRRDNITEWISSGGNGLRTVVIVWDKIPPSEDTTINVADYVTPFDWALVCSRIIFSKWRRAAQGAGPSRANDLPRLRIIILDLDSQEHSDAFAYNAFRAVGHALPWIQIYRPTQGERHELETLLTIDNESISQLRTAIAPGSLGLETLFEDILSYDEGSASQRSLSLRDAQAGRNSFHVVESLAALWQSSLVRPGERHHVGNLLAPMLLAKGLPANLQKKVESNILQADPLRNALKVLVQVIGLEGTQGTSKAYVPPEGILKALKDESDIFGRRGGVRVLLVDDQYRLGYQHVLASLLFGDQYDPARAGENNSTWLFEQKGSGALSCEADVDRLFRMLENLPPVDEWQEPRLLKFDPPADILILDLRLWAKPDDRHLFLDRLVRICKSLRVATRGNKWTPMSDPAFTKAYEQAKAVLDVGGQSSSEIEALVLLPLLLSYYDPSLPIILFSSTHQRSIVQMVSHRPNIITDFAKPILSGYGEEREAAELVDDLKRALHTAVRFHEARVIWARLVSAGWKLTPVFECFTGKQVGKVKTMGVYNVPPSATVNPTPQWPRVPAGSAHPRINDRELRVLLAKHFTNYIQKAHYFDFASIPWETLEGNLVPKEILDDPEIFNVDFGIRPDLITPFEMRNHVARALEIIRHKKAHGNAPLAADDTHAEGYRVGAILQFSLLLDFLEGAEDDTAQFQPTIKQMWNYIRVRHGHLIEVKKPLEPNALTADGRVPWVDFIAYTALWGASRAEDDGTWYLTAETVNQVQRLAQQLLNTFWGKVDALSRGQVMTGTVQAENPQGFDVEVSQGFWAFLPRSNTTSTLKAGVQCSVKIDGKVDKNEGVITLRE